MNISQIFLLASSLFLLLLQFLFQTCDAKCHPSSCGIITNISSPFRHKGDPKHCGNHGYELVCDNNVTSLFLNSHKYYVKEINYGTFISEGGGVFENSTLRLVDASINDDDIYSFPNYSLYQYNFKPVGYPYLLQTSSSYPYDYLALPINLMSCPYPLKNSSLFTDITRCQTSDSNSRFTYIKVGHMTASEVEHMCRVDVIVMTSWEFKDLKNVTLEEIHHSMLYGFELTVCPQCDSSWKAKGIMANFEWFFVSGVAPILVIIAGLLCAAIGPPVMTVIGFAAVLGSFGYFAFQNYPWSPFFFAPTTTVLFSSILIFAPRIIFFPFAIWLLLYKFRRRHLSVFEGIESFLQSDDNNLKPIRYSYQDIKKMTKNFQEKIGEGGYGHVYKGKLRSGHYIAVKVLGKSGANIQDFINEIATIGRIHHVNVIKLVGYCAQGSKRALVYDFMPNGSLEKYILKSEKSNSLSWDLKFEIAVGVARGIEYLHRGCDVQILHFDIKPHNILLDAKFVPKVSDFGLAKFYSTDKTIVTMTQAKGTVGYVAPELINRSIGAVSNKADVYSFGMMLMEMVSLKRDLIGNNGDSNLCFPYWIYDYLSKGQDLDIRYVNDENNDNDEDDRTKKLVRKMAMVALWCTQMCPNGRPSMNKVLEMLEGDVECLRIPDQSMYTDTVLNMDHSGSTYSTESSHLLSNHISSSVEINIQ